MFSNNASDIPFFTGVCSHFTGAPASPPKALALLNKQTWHTPLSLRILLIRAMILLCACRLPIIIINNKKAKIFIRQLFQRPILFQSAFVFIGTFLKQLKLTKVSYGRILF